MLSNKVLLLAIITLIGFTAQSQTIIPGGFVSGTWDEAGSPYLVQAPISIHQDSSLQIMENVIASFADSARLSVYGHIDAINAGFSYIYFTAESNWDGIYIKENLISNDTCRFVGCIFENTQHYDDIPGGVMNIENRNKVIIHGCWFDDAFALEKGGALYLSNANVIVRHSYFQFNMVMDTGSSQGGAVYMIDSEPLFFGNYFANNSAVNGGAMYCKNSSPILEQCIFIENLSSGGGGAVVFHESGQPIIKDCLFENNHANGSGGAIAFLEDIHTQLESCQFINNASESDIYLADGGAILVTPYDNEVNFLNCEFSMNYAEDYGGALYVTSPTNVIGCLFDGNYMPTFIPSFGGAITVGETSMRIINSTFTNNDAMLGPTLFAEDAEVFMLNSIQWNEGGFVEPSIFLLTNTNPPLLSVDHSNVQGGTEAITGGGSYQVHWKSGNLNVDPHFLSPGNDFSLAWNSPCINAGRTDTLQLLIPAEDIAGNPRIMGGEIDMGCYEYQDPISVSELSEKQEFMIYPNPARDCVNINNISGTDFTGQLYLSDLSGRISLAETINIQNHSSVRISIEDLLAGMYILNLVSDYKFESFKVIIR